MLCLVTQLCSTLHDPMDYSPLGSSVHGDSPGKNTGVGSRSLLQGIFPTQGSNSGLPHCMWIFLSSEAPEKPKNTGVSSLSLLQGIFLTKQSNQGFLHCRQILYQLSYQESPSAANFLAMIWGYHIKPSPKLQSACLPNGTTGSPSRDSRLIYVLQ